MVSPEGFSGSLPSWSPDGSRIVLSTYLNRSPLLAILKPDGGEVIALTSETKQDFGPEWSPDGGRIAFVSTTDAEGNYSDSDIYTIRPDGTGRVALTDDPAGDNSPTWSPDGAQIAFVSTRDGHGAIYVMNADGSGQARLTLDSEPSSYPAWAPSLATRAAPGGEALPPLPVTPNPRFNPEGDPWCFDTPDQVVAGDWQVVAPRDLVVIGEAAELALRDTVGQPGTEYRVTARVLAPDGLEATSSATLVANEWAQLVFPDYFLGAATDQRGAYTIVWEIEGNFVACDGFVVGGGASPQ
jgi:hypothetical protein